MEESLVLRGYQFSVYNRIARIALHEKLVDYEIEEVNPFDASIPKDYIKLHPFRRVPVLSHGNFNVYETTAITRYIDAAFDGPALLPSSQYSIARVAQIVSILDSYGYSPMIQQVFAHRVFRPAAGIETDEAEVKKGLDASLPVLRALNAIAAEGLVLNGKIFTLADCHLAPIVAYFTLAPEGMSVLSKFSALMQWWGCSCQRNSLKETDPGLPSR